MWACCSSTHLTIFLSTFAHRLLSTHLQKLVPPTHLFMALNLHQTFKNCHVCLFSSFRLYWHVFPFFQWIRIFCPWTDGHHPSHPMVTSLILPCLHLGIWLTDVTLSRRQWGHCRQGESRGARGTLQDFGTLSQGIFGGLCSWRHTYALRVQSRLGGSTSSTPAVAACWDAAQISQDVGKDRAGQHWCPIILANFVWHQERILIP